MSCLGFSHRDRNSINRHRTLPENRNSPPSTLHPPRYQTEKGVLELLRIQKSCFKTKPINIKFIAFTIPMSVVFPKAKPINLLNSAAKSRSPEPVTVELFWEPWHCLEIPTMATRFKPPLSKSKDSLENSRKSSLQTGITKAKRNLKNSFADSFSPSKNRLSIRSSASKEKDSVKEQDWKPPSVT